MHGALQSGSALCVEVRRTSGAYLCTLLAAIALPAGPYLCIGVLSLVQPARSVCWHATVVSETLTGNDLCAGVLSFV